MLTTYDRVMTELHSEITDSTLGLPLSPDNNARYEPKRPRVITTYRRLPTSRSYEKMEITPRTMEPYVELLIFSPARLSSYTDWKPDSSKILERLVGDYTNGDLILVDEDDNVPLVISVSPSRIRSVNMSASLGLSRKTVNAKKRASPLSASSDSSSSSTEQNGKNRLRTTRSGILSQTVTNGPNKKRVSLPTESPETSASSFKVSKRTNEKRKLQFRNEEDGSSPQRAKDKDQRLEPEDGYRGRQLDRAEGEKSTRSTRDPDDVKDALTEDEGDLLEELEFEEPERFKSDTRLRKKKETPFQRKLRKLKAQREGVVTETSSNSSSVVQRRRASDPTPSTAPSSLGTDDFIIDDGGRVQEGLLPFQFSSSSA